MVDFIDDHRVVYGVEPICQLLPIAPSTYHKHKAREANPARAPARVQRDAALRREIERVWHENFQVYGVRKVWRQLNRERVSVARCTVERLMRDMGLRGVTRGNPPRTTHANPRQAALDDHIRRDFTAEAPNRLWVADFTYGAPSLRRRHGRRFRGLSMSGM